MAVVLLYTWMCISVELAVFDIGLRVYVYSGFILEFESVQMYFQE